MVVHGQVGNRSASKRLCVDCSSHPPSCTHNILSLNLMTCVSTLSTVARQRPMHFPTVVQSFELLQGLCSPVLLVKQQVLISSFPFPASQHVSLLQLFTGQQRQQTSQGRHIYIFIYTQLIYQAPLTHAD